MGLTQTNDGRIYDAGVSPVIVNLEWNAASVDKASFVAHRAYRVRSIIARVTAAGTDASAVTATVNKAPSATAVSGGTALHQGTINLKGTANTNQTLSLSTTTADYALAAGDCIGLDVTGVMTAATGVVTVSLDPVP